MDLIEDPLETSWSAFACPVRTLCMLYTYITRALRVPDVTLCVLYPCLTRAPRMPLACRTRVPRMPPYAWPSLRVPYACAAGFLSLCVF